MATYPERFKIERDSQLDPSSTELPADTTPAEVQDANELRVRVRQALLDASEEALAGPIPASGPGREAIAYLRRVAENPDQPTSAAIRLLLSRFDTLTPTQIFAATDADVRAGVDAILPAMALGATLRR